MAHETSTVTGFAVDNASATLTNISGSVNSISWDGSIELLDDTGLGDTTRTVVGGLGDAKTVTVNGMLNSTTRAIFAPLAATTTSITKTIEIKLSTGSYYTGEAWPRDVNLSFPLGAINTWSCTFQAQAGLTATSVTAVA